MQNNCMSSGLNESLEEITFGGVDIGQGVRKSQNKITGDGESIREKGSQFLAYFFFFFFSLCWHEFSAGFWIETTRCWISKTFLISFLVVDADPRDGKSPDKCFLLVLFVRGFNLFIFFLIWRMYYSFHSLGYPFSVASNMHPSVVQHLPNMNF